MNRSDQYPVHGAGLGLRRDFIAAALEQPPAQIDFWEVAPKNWMGVGGRSGKQFRALTERHPFVCHGLSLSIGSPQDAVRRIVQELNHPQPEVVSNAGRQLLQDLRSRDIIIGTRP